MYNETLFHYLKTFQKISQLPNCCDQISVITQLILLGRYNLLHVSLKNFTFRSKIAMYYTVVIALFT